MASLESPVLSLEDCLKIEDKILALGGDLTVLEDHYRELVKRNPDVGGGPELIAGLGLVLIEPRFATRAEVEAGACSPSEALSFFRDAESIQELTVYSDWNNDQSLWPAAETAFAPDTPREFGGSWRCQFSHIPPEKFPEKFRLGHRSSSYICEGAEPYSEAERP